MQIVRRANIVFLKARQLAQLQFYEFFLSIFLGLGLGFLISRGDWLIAIAFAALMPLTVLLIARPFVGVILWLVLFPLSSALPNQEMMYWTLHRILISVILCISLLPRLLNSTRQPRIRFGLPEICLALLAVYVPVSILLSNQDWFQPLKAFFDLMLLPFFMYLVIRLSNLDFWKQQLLQWTALFIGLSQSLIGLISWLAPGLLPPVWLSYFQTRMSGSLLNPNTYSVVLGFSAMVLFNSAMSRRPGLVRSVFLLTCGINLVCIFLSMERAVWLGSVVAILGLMILYPKAMLRYLIIILVCFSMIGAGLLSEKITQASQRINSQSQVDVRLALNDAMFEMIRAKPLFGWGYSKLNQIIGQYYRPEIYANVGRRFETSHNTYLTIFSELGLVGFLLYLVPVAWLFIASVQTWRGPPKMDPERCLMLWTLWLALLQHFIVSNFMDMRYFPIGLTLWWMNLGLIANLVHQHTETRDRYPSSWIVQTQRSV